MKKSLINKQIEEDKKINFQKRIDNTVQKYKEYVDILKTNKFEVVQKNSTKFKKFTIKIPDYKSHNILDNLNEYFNHVAEFVEYIPNYNNDYDYNYFFIYMTY